MQIVLSAPREFEAEVEVDAKNKQLVITPFFQATTGIKTVGYFVVRGQQGKERRFVLLASGRNGRLQVAEARQVDTEFDKHSQDAADPPDDVIEEDADA